MIYHQHQLSLKREIKVSLLFIIYLSILSCRDSIPISLQDSYITDIPDIFIPDSIIGDINTDSQYTDGSVVDIYDTSESGDDLELSDLSEDVLISADEDTEDFYYIDCESGNISDIIENYCGNDIDVGDAPINKDLNISWNFKMEGFSFFGRAGYYNGRVYITNSEWAEAYVIRSYFGVMDENGNLINKYTENMGKISYPVIDANRGLVYINNSSNELYIFDSDGNLIKKVDTDSNYFWYNDYVLAPALNSKGEVIMAISNKEDNEMERRLVKIKEGEIIWSIVEKDKQWSVFVDPVVGLDDRIYVMDLVNDTITFEENIYCYNDNGELIKKERIPSSISSMMVDRDGNIYLIDSTSVVSLTKDCEFRWKKVLATNNYIEGGLIDSEGDLVIIISHYPSGSLTSLYYLSKCGDIKRIVYIDYLNSDGESHITSDGDVLLIGSYKTKKERAQRIVKVNKYRGVVEDYKGREPIGLITRSILTDRCGDYFFFSSMKDELEVYFNKSILGNYGIGKSEWSMIRADPQNTSRVQVYK